MVPVRFFQQNKAWNLEPPDNTVRFNGILRAVAAARGIPFVDMYARFDRVEYSKTIRDLTVDHIHHPTSFGHQLYYVALMSALAPWPMSEREFFKLQGDPEI